MSNDVVTFQRNKANHHQYLLKPAYSCRVWGRGAAKNCSCLLNYCFLRFILKKLVCLHATGSPKWSLFYFPAHRTLIFVPQFVLYLSEGDFRWFAVDFPLFPLFSGFSFFIHGCNFNPSKTIREVKF